MLQNISKPTFFGNGHVLNSKLVSEPCKKFWNKILNTVNSTSVFIQVSKILAQIGGTYKCATAFLTTKHRKSTQKTITQFLCLIFKNILIG